MELTIQHQDLSQIEADLLVVNLFEKETDLTGATKAIDTATSGLIKEHIKDHEFEGKALDTLVLHSPSGVRARHVLVMGLGPKAEFSAIIARQVAAKSLRKARKLKAKSLATIAHGINELNPATAGEMLAEGLILGNYEFSRYKTKDQEKREQLHIQSVIIVEQDQAKLDQLEAGLKKGEAIATAILNARDIVNEPPSAITPTDLVRAAEEIAGLSPAISVTSLNEDQLAKEGYNAILAVSSGSEEPAYLIHLHYKPQQPQGSIAFVGKGVTFDSGGLGIKPWAAMLNMKADMAGGAAVLGIFQALAELETIGMPINMEVHGVIAATENMISGKAMRPDDIIATKNGKTVEVIHTDAEGRLILADALAYTLEQKPERIIDFATLTGAAIRALGRLYSAYMGNDRQLLDLVGEASRLTGELAWELPLPKEYQKYVESQFADLQNVTTNSDAPGAIIAGLFLQEFVDNQPWTHIDIAGPAWQDEKFNPLYTKGATGYGILLGLKLLELLSNDTQNR